MSTQPTDAEILELASQYWYSLDETESETEIELVRAALAKWGQPAQAAEPVARLVIGKTKGGVSLTHIAEPAAFQLQEGMYALYTAPQPSPAAQGDAIEHELAMLIRRIVSSARRNCEDGSNVLKLANEAWAYLVRKGLNGSPLRDAGIESDVANQAADSVQEDAARYRWLRAPTTDVALVLDKMTEWVPPDDVVPGVGGYWVYEYRAGDELDAAVDAARKQGENHDR